MCGIAGIISLDGFNPITLTAMTHMVSYRGPNGFGFAYASLDSDEPVEVIHNQDRPPGLARPLIGLGSRRLAIQDVSPLGNMPMQTENGDYTLVFNGEIYNFVEIREELEKKGHKFRTGGDTEVILHAYQEWQEDCLPRFNGMWSFALFDRPRRKLFCARDRFGVKPFYYTFTNRRFYFGSEIKQVLLASEIPRHANDRTVFTFLEYGLLDFSAETFFDHVLQLPAGHWLSLNISEPLKPTLHRYWELRLTEQPKVSDREAIEEFSARFESAVKLRLRSDVPVGVCLSGGLDSSAIVCKANALAPEIKFQTFSACFEDRAIDEREYIAMVLRSINGVGHEIFPNGKSFWEALETIAYHQDEPVGGPSVFAQWSVMQEAKRNGIPVVLGGQGGDEILCGYQKYRYFYLWHLLRNGNPKFIPETLSWLSHGTRSYWTLDAAVRYLPAPFRGTMSVTKSLCTPSFRNEFQHIKSKLGAADTIADRQKIDLSFTSLPCLLRHEDRNSMAHSVESRLPFLDYRLAEFAVNCSSALKLQDGWSKWILRESQAGTLPEKIRLRRTKLGFDTPQEDWIRMGLQNGHRDLWENPKLHMSRFLDSESLSRECKKFLRGATMSLPAPTLFRAISLELWAKVHGVS